MGEPQPRADTRRPTSRHESRTPRPDHGGGQPIFIGGLIRRASTYQRDGIPLLSSIPIIGRAFANSVWSDSSTETVVIVTPRIVPDEGVPDLEADRVGVVEQGLIRKGNELDSSVRREAGDPESSLPAPGSAR